MISTVKAILVIAAVASLGAFGYASTTHTPPAPVANPNQPAELVGTWVSSPYPGDTLLLSADGSSIRRGVLVAWPKAVWRVAVDSTTRNAVICFDTAASGFGTGICGPLRFAGDNMNIGTHPYLRARP